MNNNIFSDKISFREITKKILKSNSFGRILYEPLHSLWKMYNVPRRRRLLQQHGAETLQILHDFFMKNGIEYYLDFGTLLGIIRENTFIKHDDDIDLTIRMTPISPLQIINKLEQIGFRFVHGFHVNGKIIEFTLVRKGLTVDFFIAFQNASFDEKSYIIYGCYYNPNHQYPKSNANNYRAWYFPYELKPIEIEFKGTNVCVPNQPEALLKSEYGINWKRPEKNFKADQAELKYVVQTGYAYRETNLKLLSLNSFKEGI